MLLQDFYDYKNQLMKDLLTNENIVHLVNEDIGTDDAKSLAYTQVFPYEYVPETIEYGHTYICFDVDIQEVYNKTYLQPVIYIWVLSHKSKLRLPEGGVRTDKLCSEISKTINGSRYYGLGELNLKSVRRFAPLTDFQGKQLTFEAVEFNRQSPSNKPIPANRKHHG